MIKNMLKTISDNDAIEVATLLLKNTTSYMFNFTFEKITRQKYDVQHGVDAEESVSIYFWSVVKNDADRELGWKDRRIRVQLIESDAYHNYPYFAGYSKEDTDEVWKYYYLSNHIEAIEYLQSKQLL